VDRAPPPPARSRIAEDIDTLAPVSAPVAHATRLVDATSECGIEFRYQNGAQGNSLMVEATGGGCGWLDYDGDGHIDLYLVQGGDPAQPASASQPADCLYRNLGAGRFQDVTAWIGIDERGYGQGIAVGDYDNDGFEDIFVTNVGTNGLYHNQGDGTFLPAESATFGSEDLWSSSAAWADIDRDGDLDLYVARYVLYDPRQPKVCHRKSGKLGTCHPKEVDPCPDECYVNQGDGTFRPSARELGLYGPGNRGLGVVIADFDNDDWPDIYVANDTTENFLFLNQRDGRFSEQAQLLGCAVNGNGSPQASMGIAVGDYDRNGYLDLYLTHYNMEWNTLYQNLGPSGFHDVTAAARLATPTMDKLGFGTVMADFDQNGQPELFVANGHIDDVRADGIEFEMAAQLFAFNGQTWDDCSLTAGEFFNRKYLGRGVATADYDGDGDLDLAFVPQNDAAVVLRNDSQRGHWLKLGFLCQTSNRRGIGTRVTLRCGEETFVQELAGGTSYCAAHEPMLLFGLGNCAGSYSLEVRWPNGTKQTISDVAPDQHVVLREPQEQAP
jgi:hypothetical protein